MPKLNVTIEYGADHGDTLEIIYNFKKEFMFSFIPNMPCYIVIGESIVKKVKFNFPIYNPKTDTYSITNENCYHLVRYDYIHHRRFFIAWDICKRFEENGWESTRENKQDRFNPFSEEWDKEYFLNLEKHFPKSNIIEKLLGEMA